MGKKVKKKGISQIIQAKKIWILGLKKVWLYVKSVWRKLFEIFATKTFEYIYFRGLFEGKIQSSHAIGAIKTQNFWNFGNSIFEKSKKKSLQ